VIPLGHLLKVTHQGHHQAQGRSLVCMIALLSSDFSRRAKQIPRLHCCSYCVMPCFEDICEILSTVGEWLVWNKNYNTILRNRIYVIWSDHFERTWFTRFYFHFWLKNEHRSPWTSRTFIYILGFENRWVRYSRFLKRYNIWLILEALQPDTLSVTSCIVLEMIQ